jgi:hypothetical protein
MKNNLNLALKIEGAIAQSHVAYVESYNQLFETNDAKCITVVGAKAVFAGIDDVLNQVIGLGLYGPVPKKEFYKLEQFYKSRQAKIAIELCPLADQSLLSLLKENHYAASEFSNLFYLDPKSFDAPIHSSIQIKITKDIEQWAKIVAQGFLEEDPIPLFLEKTFRAFANIPEVTCFFALINGAIVGGAAIGIYKGIADLGFASTLPISRGKGVQKELLNVRLKFAQHQGCILAISTAEPGSISAQNMEKIGFKLAYTRTKFISD